MSEITPWMQDLFDAIDAYEAADREHDYRRKEDLRHSLVGAARRLRDAHRPPCPITKVTVLHELGGGYGWFGERGTPVPRNTTGRHIILHPAEPGATEGRYTWDVDR